MTGKIEPALYVQIDRCGDGHVVLFHRNQKKALCVDCQTHLMVGIGYRFVAERGAGTKSGYICKKCVSARLRTVKNWHYNSFTQHLFPADFRTTHKVSGGVLAEAWGFRGQKGIHDACMETKRNKK